MKILKFFLIIFKIFLSVQNVPKMYGTYQNFTFLPLGCSVATAVLKCLKKSDTSLNIGKPFS